MAAVVVVVLLMSMSAVSGPLRSSHRPGALVFASTPAPLASSLEEAMVSRVMPFEAKVDAISAHFAQSPGSIVLRMGEVSARLGAVALSWAANAPDRGEQLSACVSKLGVVFVKLAQTLATRPDIIGDEAAEALAELQDGNVQFDDALAMRTIADEFGSNLVAAERVPLSRLSAKLEERSHQNERASEAAEAGAMPVGPLFAWLSAEPIAAASLAQVYRGETPDGVPVAVKVRRPRVSENIALDYLVVRQLLALAKGLGVLSEEADIAEMTAEVGAGLFRELGARLPCRAPPREPPCSCALFRALPCRLTDFVWEAQNAKQFAIEHASSLPDVVVPLAIDSLTSRRVLCSAWVDGRKLGDLDTGEQERMIRLGLDACFTQMLRTGFIHADPHYGNMVRFATFALSPSCTHTGSTHAAARCDPASLSGSASDTTSTSRALARVAALRRAARSCTREVASWPSSTLASLRR